MTKAQNTENPQESEGSLLDNLTHMGFTGPEARTYEALISAQPATAYELAKISGLARANSYNAVTNLVKKRAIQPITSQPVRYAITSPQHFFAGIADDIQTTATKIQDQVTRSAKPVGNEFVEVLEGKPAVDDKVISLIDSARDDLHFKSSFELLDPYLPSIERALDRGARVTIVATGEGWEALQAAGARIVPHEGTGSAPSVANDVALTVVADAEASFVGTMRPFHRGYSAENATLVYVIQMMILHEIYLSEIVSAIGADNLAELGISFEELRERYRPPSHGTRMAANP